MQNIKFKSIFINIKLPITSLSFVYLYFKSHVDTNDDCLRYLQRNSYVIVQHFPRNKMKKKVNQIE